jgi:hypothetical protein
VVFARLPPINPPPWNTTTMGTGRSARRIVAVWTSTCCRSCGPYARFFVTLISPGS